MRPTTGVWPGLIAQLPGLCRPDSTEKELCTARHGMAWGAGVKTMWGGPVQPGSVEVSTQPPQKGPTHEKLTKHITSSGCLRIHSLFGIFGQFGPDQVPASREHFFAGYRATSERLDGRHVMDGDGLLAVTHFCNERRRNAQCRSQCCTTPPLRRQPCFEFDHWQIMTHWEMHWQYPLENLHKPIGQSPCQP